MRARTTAALMLLGTLLLGLVLGMFVSGALAQQRRDRLTHLRGPGGFVEHMERLIQPRDDQQREALRPFLEATDQQNRAIIHLAEEDMRSAIREMSVQLDSLLDDDQRERLRDAVEHARPLAPGPGRPPPGGRPPGRPPPPRP